MTLPIRNPAVNTQSLPMSSIVHNDKIYDPTAKYNEILVSILIPVYNSEVYVEGNNYIFA